MNDQRASLEVIAPTIEEAITKGLADLGLPEEAVEVEILDEGGRGLFGLGSRQARVRLSIKDSTMETPSTVESQAAPSPQAMTAEPESEPTPEDDVSTESVKNEVEIGQKEELALHVARETMIELLERMKVEAQVTTSFGEVDHARSRIPLFVDIHGDDLSILIGPKAETLNALQYVANLIVGKELGRSVTLIVDVEGYRKRREEQIRRLARTMAEQAVATGRRQILEPMPASERRLVHIELRDHPEVTTESIDEEPRRKVTVIPKNE